MKRHQWTNPLLSMLASTAMCAILSFNQPTLRSVDSRSVNSDKLAYQSSLLTTKYTQNEHPASPQVKHQLEIALTLELFAGEQERLEMKHNQPKLDSQRKPDKQECHERAVRSVNTKYIMPMVRNTHSI